MGSGVLKTLSSYEVPHYQFLYVFSCSCDSDVPFCGTYNTQLRVSLSSFLLLFVLFAYTLLWVRILLVAWLRDSSHGSLRLGRGFFLPTCPWRLGPLASFEASILWGETL